MTPITIETILAHSKARGEPDWLANRRADAWRIFEATPPPTRSDEEWRRTDLSWMDWSDIYPSAPQLLNDSTAELLPPHLSQASIVLVEHGVDTTVVQVKPDAEAAGITAESLSTAAGSSNRLVENHLATSLVTPTTGKFEALNSALWTGGAFVHIPAGIQLEAPIVILATSNGPAAYPRTLIIADPGSSAHIVEWWQPDGSKSPQFANGSTELFVNNDAQLSYTHVQQWGPKTRGVLSQHARVAHDASMVSTNVTLGGIFHKGSIKATLSEPGAEVRLNGLSYLDAQQFVDHHTVQDHQTTDAMSDLLYVNILDNTSRSVYAGSIVVAQDAQRSNAYQRNRNLMLQSGPRADSIPRLEIMADDVRCTHGSTTSTIDPVQLYYLNSRGLDYDAALTLIVDGTLEPVLDRIPNTVVAEAVRSAVQAKRRSGPST
jgi:Fe-S cluster assembly protein SufD